ncbi:metal-sensitive transcriptional regulator [Streptomyces sp. NPDC058442]|uniref:metal-sensitive transcriptional regulator n=1 Tax=Streptomyces sp. NPDC058442 TaxID=3346503 RepID=UPI0036640DBB
MVQLPADQVWSAADRLKRAQGRLAGVVRMLEEGRDCEEAVTQLAAVDHALDRAGFAVVAGGLKECLSQEGGADGLDTQKMEKLFLSLS